MVRTIRAIFSKGVITPLEEVEIPEGKEITVTIADLPMESPEEAFKRAAGKWRGTINADELIKNIYADRLISTRPEINI